MGTIIGFVVGYLTGVSEGKDGLKRARASVQAIRNSPEVRRMMSDAVTVAQGMAARAAKGGLGSTVSSVAELISNRASERGQRAA
jgi:hypothetical protein